MIRLHSQFDEVPLLLRDHLREQLLQPSLDCSDQHTTPSLWTNNEGRDKQMHALSITDSLSVAQAEPLAGEDRRLPPAYPHSMPVKLIQGVWRTPLEEVVVLDREVSAHSLLREQCFPEREQHRVRARLLPTKVGCDFDCRLYSHLRANRCSYAWDCFGSQVFRGEVYHTQPTYSSSFSSGRISSRRSSSDRLKSTSRLMPRRYFVIRPVSAYLSRVLRETPR